MGNERQARTGPARMLQDGGQGLALDGKCWSCGRRSAADVLAVGAGLLPLLAAGNAAKQLTRPTRPRSSVLRCLPQLHDRSTVDGRTVVLSRNAKTPGGRVAQLNHGLLPGTLAAVGKCGAKALPIGAGLQQSLLALQSRLTVERLLPT